MGWISSGRVTNPVLDQVILDTGAFPGASSMNFTIVGAATVAAVFEVQHRNAANAATLKSQILAVPASGTNSFMSPECCQFPVAENERLRVIMVAGVTGSVSASLFYAG